jgi:hypothetical protein
MSQNSNQKKRGSEYYLHKQWIATKTGAAIHKEIIRAERARTIKPKVIKTGIKNEQTRKGSESTC